MAGECRGWVVLQVSSAFGTPVGGVLFSLEEVRCDSDFRHVLNFSRQRYATKIPYVKMNAFHGLTSCPCGCLDFAPAVLKGEF